MPNYNAAQPGGSLTSVPPGTPFTLFNAESPAAPQASIAFARAYSPNGSPAGMVFHVQAATGTVNIQGSNVDTDAAYQTLHTTTNLANDFYADLGEFAFYRAQLSAGAGPITVLVH